MNLIIAEKPILALAALAGADGDLKKYNGYYIKGDTYATWAFGHLLEFKEPEELDEKYMIWNLKDLPIFSKIWEKRPKIIKKIKNETEKQKLERENLQKGLDFQIETIGKLINSEKIDTIIHAGDPDEEGQYLIDELLEYFNNKKPVLRVLINDNNSEKVKQAFKKMESNDKYINAGKAAYARSFSDMIFGINGTRFFSLINPSGNVLRFGRVLIPTLGLVVNRYLDIKNHKKSYFYELFSKIEVNKKSNKNEKKEYENIITLYNQEFCDKDKRKKLIEKLAIEFEKLGETPKLSFKLNPPKEMLENGKILNKDVLNELTKYLTGTHTLIVKKEIKKEYAPLPFNLLKLQMYANSKWGYSGNEVMDITQSLRDNFKAITYNRSDCQYLSEEHYNEAPTVIPQILENLNITVSNIDFNRKSKCFNDENVTAHHAIIPTNVKIDLEKLNDKEKNIYIAISNFYIIQFLPPLIKELTTGNISILDEISLTDSSSKILDFGYKNFLNDKSEIDDHETILTNLYTGDYEFSFKESEIIEKETVPKKLYTEGTLLNDMSRISEYVEDKELQNILKKKDKGKKGENGGIGTPATRASIILNLFKSNYFELKGKNIIPTELGISFYNYLPKSIKSADITAKWWLIQEEIIDGVSDPSKLILSVLENISSIISTGYKKMDYIESQNEKKINSIGLCPICQKNVYESKVSFFCEGYKDDLNPCNFSLWKENKITNSTITLSQAKDLITGKHITIKKEKFILNSSGKLIKKEKVFLCPRCKKKNLTNNLKAYFCSCGFTLWKKHKIFGELTNEDLEKLLNNEYIEKYNLKNKNNKLYNAQIGIDDNGTYVNLKIIKFIDSKNRGEK